MNANHAKIPVGTRSKMPRTITTVIASHIYNLRLNRYC
jgi:hypothetical protein